MDKKTMYRLTYGLFVLTAAEGEKKNGCIINTAIQQTSEPNRISITVNKQNYTEGMIARTGKFNLSFLDESAPFSVFQHFGFQSGKTTDKFAPTEGIVAKAKEAANGIPYLANCTNAYLSCEVEQTIDLGSHTLFIAAVKDGELLSDLPSMSYAFYQSSVKPKPKKAESTGKVWVCKICGYVYDEAKEGTPFEALPDDWVCPLCKHGKQDFELQQ